MGEREWEKIIGFFAQSSVIISIDRVSDESFISDFIFKKEKCMIISLILIISLSHSTFYQHFSSPFLEIIAERRKIACYQLNQIALRQLKEKHKKIASIHSFLRYNSGCVLYMMETQIEYIFSSSFPSHKIFYLVSLYHLQ